MRHKKTHSLNDGGKAIKQTNSNNMKLKQLFQAYDFEEVMPVINEMFPGTSQFRAPLKKAYDLLLDMEPVSSKKSILYKIIENKANGETYMGADDNNFRSTWEVCLGKSVSRAKGVTLSDAEVLANCLVNLCFIGKYPKEFESAHRILLKG